MADVKIISDREGTLTEADIYDLEQKLGVNFPQDYRQFLLAYNGGEVEPSGFSIPNNGASLIHYFLCICPNDYGDLVNYNINVFKDRIPSNMVIIAHDPGGNNICLSVRSDSLFLGS